MTPHNGSPLRLSRRAGALGVLVLCAVWAFLLLPGLHVLLHEAEMARAARIAQALRRAGQMEDLAARGHGHHHGAQAQKGSEGAPAPHGQGSAEHLGAVLIALSPILVPPLASAHATLPPAALRCRLIPRLAPSANLSRGPPSA